MIQNEEKKDGIICSKKYLRFYMEWFKNIRVSFIAGNVFTLLEQKINLNRMKKYVKHKDFYGIVMQPEKDKVIEFNQYMKSGEMPSIFMPIFNL